MFWTKIDGAILGMNIFFEGEAKLFVGSEVSRTRQRTSYDEVHIKIQLWEFS